MGRAVELGMTHHGVGGNLEPSTMGSATQSTMGISATQFYSDVSQSLEISGAYIDENLFRQCCLPPSLGHVTLLCYSRRA